MTYAPTREDLFFAREIAKLDNWHRGNISMTMHHDTPDRTSGRIEIAGVDDEDELERYAAIFASLGYSTFQRLPSLSSAEPLFS